MANSLQGAIDSTSRVYQTEEQMLHAVPVLFFLSAIELENGPSRFVISRLCFELFE